MDKTRKHSFDRDFFEKIDTQEKAYWLGFIAADGYINSKGNTMGITLDISDKDHLQKLLNALGAHSTRIKIRSVRYDVNHPYTQKATIEFYSTKMNSDLLKLGITPTKSYTLEELKGIPKELTHHLIRGYMDGDGCIFERYSKSGKEGQNVCYSPGFTFVGTEKFLTFINKNLPVQAKTLIKDKRTSSSFTLYFRSQIRFLKICEYLYKDSTVSLDRKLKKSREILSKIEQGSSTKGETPKD